MARQDVIHKSDAALFRPMAVAAHGRRTAMESAAEPPVERWPGALRIAIAIGLAVVSWGAFTISIAFVESLLKSLAGWA